MNRREFASAALVGLAAKAGRQDSGTLRDTGLRWVIDSATGPLRANPNETRRVPLVIVGGGVAGLSAAWRLDKRGFHDFVVLEIEGQAGGNARWGENEVSAYPWAAHYLPVPDKANPLVRELCEELGLLHDGQWNERWLCHSPQERLFLHGRWQESLEPTVGAPAATTNNTNASKISWPDSASPAASRFRWRRACPTATHRSTTSPWTMARPARFRLRLPALVCRLLLP